MQILFIMSVTALLQTFNKPLSCGTKATSCTFYKVRSLFLLYIKALKKKNTEFVQPFRVSLHLSLFFFYPFPPYFFFFIFLCCIRAYKNSKRGSSFSDVGCATGYTCV